jgi:uncharacterized membrane protein
MTFPQHLSAPLFASQMPPEFVSNSVNALLVCLSLFISLIGVAVIVWGAYVSVVRLIAGETAAARGQLAKADPSSARLVFTSYLLPGLEFLIAGLVIKMSVVPDWQQVVVLAGVVMLRTLLGLSWKWEAPAVISPRQEAPVTGRLALPANLPPVNNEAAEGSALVGAHAGH